MVDIQIGDIFTAINDYGGKCQYKLIGKKDDKYELSNITLLNEPLYVTEEWFSKRTISNIQHAKEKIK